MAAADVVKVSGWEFDWLRHGFSTRSGGESSVYGGQTLNLGWTKEDNPQAVAANRRLFLQSLAGETNGMSGLRLVTIRQVHSGTVRIVRANDGALESRLESPEGKAVLEGDGLLTDVPGVLVAVGTADCVPVLVVDEAKRAVGAFHAGWRGTVAKIVEQGVVTMQQEYGSRPEDLRAAIGPGIGACCYVVGDEVRSNFDAQFAYSGELFREAESSSNGRRQFYVNLWEANRRQLLASGIGPERIAVIGECTGCSRNAAGERRYFSHRVEHGVAGRMLNAIGVVA